MKLRCIKDYQNGNRLEGITPGTVYDGFACGDRPIVFLIFNDELEWAIYDVRAFIPATSAETQ